MTQHAPGFWSPNETTTGPWYVGSEHETGIQDESIEYEYRYDERGWPFFVGINDTRIGKTDYHVAIGIQSRQDATLIAAAPDLLAALRAAEFALDTFGDKTKGTIIAALNEARQAIAKAKGIEQ